MYRRVHFLTEKKRKKMTRMFNIIGTCILALLYIVYNKQHTKTETDDPFIVLLCKTTWPNYCCFFVCSYAYRISRYILL